MESLFTNKGLILLAELLLKSSIVCGAALLFSVLARKQTAAVRHLVLGLSLTGLLLLPFIAAFGPSWKLQWLRVPDTHITNVNVMPSDGKPSIPGNDRLMEAPAPAPEQKNGIGFFLLWYLVPGLILLRLLAGVYSVSRLSRKGERLHGYPWQHLFMLFRKTFSLKRQVRLVKHHRVRTPMTWGILKPVILMPPKAKDWPIEYSWPVLFHELSHIKRWDFVVTLLSRLAGALYWFNPLIWLVLKRLHVEQEKACDEMVLRSGIKPSTYATSLLHIKQNQDRGWGHGTTALAMAEKSAISERLTTILDKQINLKEIKMKTKILLTLVVFVTVTFIGAAAPEKKKPKTPQKAPAVPSSPATPATPVTVETAPAVPAAPAVPEEPSPPSVPETPPAPETRAANVKIMQMDFISENQIDAKLLDKINHRVQVLRSELPKWIKIKEQLNQQWQTVSIYWPVKLGQKQNPQKLKSITSFEKDFKTLFATLKDKKPLIKKVHYSQ